MTRPSAVWTEGAEGLSDAELLASLLQPCGAGRSPLRVAEQLLEAVGGVSGLSRAGPALLTEVDGIGRAAASRITASLELGRRLLTRAGTVAPSLSSASAVAAYLRPRVLGLEVERMWVLALDGRNRLRGVRCVAQGGQHGCSVTAREILRAALADAASGFVLAHNHPSGEASPSPEDRSMTRAVARAAEVVGTPLLDHVIVTASGAYRSLLEEGAL